MDDDLVTGADAEVVELGVVGRRVGSRCQHERHHQCGQRYSEFLHGPSFLAGRGDEDPKGRRPFALLSGVCKD